MDLFFDLQVEWMALVVIIALALANLLTYLAVARIAAKRAATLKAMTPVMLTPLAVAACLILVASHNRPFTGEISVDPGLLVRVLPGE